MHKTLKLIILISILTTSLFLFISCNSDNPITQIFNNEVTAKQRLDSANAQALRHYPNAKLVLIFGKNVKADGKTDISALSVITSPDSIGAWLYIYRAPNDSTLKVFTPNPIPGASDCIELTAFFNINTVLNLIADTSAKNIISGALGLLTNINVNITTSMTNLIDSDNSLNLANTTSPIIKFNSSWIPGSSMINGNTFLSNGTNQSRNMFLIPSVGTLKLPNYIQNLTGFPNDLWIVNYKKTDLTNTIQNLILGTVVQNNQTINIPGIITSQVINLSKNAN